MLRMTFYNRRFRFFVLLSFLVISSIAAQSERPNFIFILTDDQPVGYLHFEGNELVNTPHLDQLAKEGIYFSNAYVTSAICTPSRTSYLLSQFERRHGVNFNSGTAVSEAAWQLSYPMQLRAAGYHTGWIGKNHVPVGPKGYQSGIMEKSFDYWYAGHQHLTFYPKDRHSIFASAKADTQAEILQEGVVDFLNPTNRSLEGALHFLTERPTDQPFCLSINLNLPHNVGTSSMASRPTDDVIYQDLYRDQSVPLPKYYLEKAAIQQPKLPPELLKVENRQSNYAYVDSSHTLQDRYIRHMQAMTGIDRLVGNIRIQLDRLGLADNTVLIFTSDHGLFNGQFGLGGKAFCYQQTTHVPLLIFDPRTRQSASGRTTDALVQSIDIAPTLLSMAAVAIPLSYQGKDLSGFINQSDTSAVREYLFTENLWSNHFGNPRCEAIQNKAWKYIRYYHNENLGIQEKQVAGKALGFPVRPYGTDNNIHQFFKYRQYIEASLRGEPPVYEELFDLKNDPAETTNLAPISAHSTVLHEMRKQWAIQLKWARGTGLPGIRPYFKEKRYE